ncbi:hypothetical protein SAMN04488021_11328 [Paracoccus aminovorans]|uniref:Peptidoglycan binding domain-containing protein n=1 Tax=Paracoccus aminovorans TaxID=34004 RepID=A0A1I3A881_9RHOB|nr:hypothetical protein [Paracoccus aminovorans]CQR83852.1 metalloendopeptidase-like membrane protein [Paracoccus aminovorans]SFH46323.1 hypothetical protein SAMN04488021_11328 [Paracoccus aminovorans]
MRQRGAYLAGIAVLASWLGAGIAAAQGLVITPLPSDQVIPAAEPPAAVPILPLSEPEPPARAGLPRPSIVIGDLAVLAGFDPRGPLGLPFAVREAIRQRDAALFERLLGRGAFDPDRGRLAEAIQTELRRLDCYGGGIDGAWGGGSVRAVQRWSQAAKTEVGDDPEVPLFRAIARSADLRCAAAVAVPVAPAATPRSGTARAAPARESRSAPAAGRTVQQPAPPRQPAVREQPSTGRQINPSLMGSGLFR